MLGGLESFKYLVFKSFRLFHICNRSNISCCVCFCQVGQIHHDLARRVINLRSSISIIKNNTRWPSRFESPSNSTCRKLIALSSKQYFVTCKLCCGFKSALTWQRCVMDIRVSSTQTMMRKGYIFAAVILMVLLNFQTVSTETAIGGIHGDIVTGKKRSKVRHTTCASRLTSDGRCYCF